MHAQPRTPNAAGELQLLLHNYQITPQLLPSSSAPYPSKVFHKLVVLLIVYEQT
jgi:hypothetical protein